MYNKHETSSFKRTLSNSAGCVYKKKNHVKRNYDDVLIFFFWYFEKIQAFVFTLEHGPYICWYYYYIKLVGTHLSESPLQMGFNSLFPFIKLRRIFFQIAPNWSTSLKINTSYNEKYVIRWTFICGKKMNDSVALLRTVGKSELWVIVIERYLTEKVVVSEVYIRLKIWRKKVVFCDAFS